MGTFAPVALQFSGSAAAQKVRDRVDDLSLKTLNENQEIHDHGVICWGLLHD